MKLTGKTSLCRACGRVFVTTSQFDAHRAGKHGVDRHCLPVETIPGWRQNKHGRWTRNPPRLPLRVDLDSTISRTPWGTQGVAP